MSVASLALTASTDLPPPATSNVMLPSASSAMFVSGRPGRMPPHERIEGVVSSVNDVTFEVPGKQSPSRDDSVRRLSASSMSTYWWDEVLLTVFLSQTEGS